MAASFRGILSGLIDEIRGKNDMEKERQAYMEDALYFKKGSEINDPSPGNKINRSQVDAIVSSANMGVTTGLMTKESGDRFIANQFQELRNDFAVNAKDKEGNIIKLPVTPGKTNKAADVLYGLKSGQGITFYEPNKETKTGREFSSEGKRYATEDPNSPYNKSIPPEQLQANSKIALLTWISKQGKDIDETTMNWNGDARYGAKEHLAKVKRREEDLGADYNKDIREYIVERTAYPTRYKGKSSDPMKDLESKLNPSEAERNIINYHRNTIKSGKVGSDDKGRPVTVYSTGIEIQEGSNKGKFVSVPGFVNGKIIRDENALYNYWKKDIESGKWPMYKSGPELNKRSQDLHQIMDDEETMALQSRAKSKK